MKLVLNHNKEGVARVWVDDKELDSYKILSLRIDISAKEKLAEIAFNLDNFTLKDEVNLFPIIVEPSTQKGVEFMKKLGREFIKKAKEIERRLKNK
jgi:hypothetical protein